REMIRALAAQGRDADATAAVEGLAKAEPEVDDVRLYRAIVHAAAKRDAEARRELEALLKENPFYHSEIEEEPAFEGLRKEKGLADALGRAREKVEYDAQVEEKNEDDDWAGVLELSRKRLERAPDDGDAWEWSGQALRQLKRFAEAEKALRTAIEKLPEAARGYSREELGLALAQLGRTDEALAVAEALQAGRKGGSLRLRAFALALAKRDDEAAKALGALLGEFKGYVWIVERDPAFEGLRKRPDVAEMIQRAKPVPKK
ncbi:MAG TPA: tetratricopeptide repeat protein, partial [Planctomycetota bacterium]|nr:tetratricopeptide repeat protein [Planctomycetota bacterium]